MQMYKMRSSLSVKHTSRSREMQVYVYLLLSLAVFLRECNGAHTIDESPLGLGLQDSGDDDPNELDNGDDRVPLIRWCVTTDCEMKKCWRMTMEFNYKLSGQVRWSCVMELTEDLCMHRVHVGRAELMTAEGEAVYKAGRFHDLIPVMYEKLDTTQLEHFQKTLQRNNMNLSSLMENNGEIRQYSVALVKKTHLNISTFKDLDQTKSCHGRVASSASFKGPICSLIQKDVIPQVGSVYECAGEFFSESCVPGVQSAMYNTYLTNPESLCGICKGQDTDEFCQMTDKEPYHGFKGSISCLMEEAGDVGFFNTRDIMKYYGIMGAGFDLVCQDQRRSLTWKNIMKPECHLTIEHPQVVLVSALQTEQWIQMTVNLLKEAVRVFNNSHSTKEFDLFSSVSYCDDNKEQTASDLIFKDSSYSLEMVPKEKMAYHTFLDSNTLEMWKTCEKLEPKPRAFICVVGESETKTCKKMVENMAMTAGTKAVSWGCVQVDSKDECVTQIHEGGADIVSLNSTELFIAGKRYNLVPFMSEENKGMPSGTESITVAVMRKGNSVLGQSQWLRGWKFCSPGGVYSPAFLHSIGWLLANGSLPRNADPIRSFSSFLDNSCQQGMSPQYLMNNPFLRETVNWETLLENRVVDWNDYYQTSPYATIDKDDRLNGIINIPMHVKYNFDSDVMHQLFYNMATQWSDVVEKIRDRFDWRKYSETFHEFYDVMPKWKLIEWVWSRPAFWSEREWHLFTNWAEKRWDQEEDWCSFVDWSNDDWVKFMNWNDVEFAQYSKGRAPVHKDIFIRATMYCNRLEWLKEQWKKTQWEIPELRRCLHEKATQNSADCLNGIVAGNKDIAFMDVYYLNNTVAQSGVDPDDLALVCPDGSTVNYAQPRAHEACNFGRIASRALVIHENQDAKWRWQVTKAFLEAQEHSFFAGNQNDDFHVSGNQDDGIFGKECESLKPISLVNQTYQTWLGPMFLRSMEGLLQKPVRNGGYTSYEDDDDECQDCDTQGQRSNIYRRGYTTDDPHMKGPHMKGGVGPHMKGPRMNGGDGTSARRSRVGDPHQKGPHMKGGVGPHMKGPRMNGGDGTSARRTHSGDPHQKGPHMKGGVGPHMKGPRMNGGDGTSARRTHSGDPHQKGPHMKGGVGPHMKGPRMNGGDGTSARRTHLGDPHQKGPHMKGGVGPHMKGPRMNGGDGTSSRRTHSGDPHQKGPHMKGGVGPHMKGPRMNGGDGTSARRTQSGDPHQKGPHMKGGVGPHMKGPRMNGGDGTSARRTHSGDPHQKGPHMKGGVGPHMKGPRMNGGDGTSATRSQVGDPRQIRPRMDGRDVAYARGHNIRRPAERALMYFWKPRGKYPLPISPVGVQEEPPLTDLNIHDVELGPSVRDAKWPREEFYTKVVYERNGTCSAILRDIACYGDPRTVTRSVGRIGRTMMSIPVCSTAAAFMKTYAQFTCNTGVGYMAPVLMPTRCLYLPCTRQYWIPEWTRDEYWKEEGDTRGKDPQMKSVASMHMSQVWKQRHV